MPKHPLKTAINFALTTREDGWIALLPVGKVEGRDGRYWFNHSPDNVIDSIIANGFDLPVDINHSTELCAPEGEESPAYAWIGASRDSLRVADGFILGKPEWNNPDDNPVTRREYRYASPVVTFDPATLAVIAITSIGLTNSPNLHLSALNHYHYQQPENVMDKDLLAALGLPETADKLAALNAIQQLKADKASALNSAANPSLDKFVPRADYDVALNRASSAEQKLADAKKAEAEIAIETAINAALTAGKITPATVEYHKAQCRTEGGLERFNAFIAAQPVNSATTDSGLNSRQAGGGTATALNAEEAYVCKQLGISHEEFLKTKGVK